LEIGEGTINYPDVMVTCSPVARTVTGQAHDRRRFWWLRCCQESAEGLTGLGGSTNTSSLPSLEALPVSCRKQRSVGKGIGAGPMAFEPSRHWCF
jgi:hypothetical protein